MAEVAWGGSAWSRRDVVLVLVVPVLAAVIASVAIIRYHDLDQSSWRGASFGMFASYEYEQGRYVRALAVDDGQRRQIAIPADLDGLREEATTIPGGSAPRRLAEALRSRTSADEVVIEVRGHDVDITRDDIRVGVRVIRSVRVP